MERAGSQQGWSTAGAAGARAPQDHDAALLAAGGPSASLIRNKDRILECFRERVRTELPAARPEPGPIIIDTLPAFITRLALALAPGTGLAFASEYSTIARQPGLERAQFTHYALADVIREYQILREILVQRLRADDGLSGSDWDTIHRSIDEAIAESASSFVRVQQDFRELFTAALSHDFRGPLSNASNYLELLRRDADPMRRGHFATRGLDNLRQLSRMITELLDVARANAGAGLSVRIQPCAATPLLRDLLDDLRSRHGERFVLAADREVHGYWDGERLSQALHNLIENAVKYGRDGAPVTVQITEKEGRAVFSVHNEGDPIPAEILPDLFKPFRRAPTAETGAHPGWGLGLVLVEAIAQAHGGSVSVDSSAELGTSFIIDIPADSREWRRAHAPH
jgi:signal transduction histidine kinase